MINPTRHLRILDCAPGIVAYYDGRVPGHRFAPGPNWVDDGALSLGIASYAIVDGSAALVYDTHVSVAHGAAIKADLLARGVVDITVVLSHCHLDHVAGTEAFAGCEIVANHRTAQHLATDRAAIESGCNNGMPAINPLLLPTTAFHDKTVLTIGQTRVELIEANIHSDDATVLWLPDQGILLAGDTVEDTVTYVGAPQDFAVHLTELDRLAALDPTCVLPNHGAPDVIAQGGYSPALLPATQRYIRWLSALRNNPDAANVALTDVLASDLAAGTLTYFAPYEEVHRQNIARSLQAR